MKQKPIYIQIEDDIIEKIKNKELKVNEQIMTEEQLCEKYGASRMTINKAISNLVQNGYIYRKAGKGSFVQPPHVVKNTGQGRSFSEDMKYHGFQPGAKLIEYCIKRASEAPDAAQKMGLAEEDMLHYFVRVRTGDGLPIAISYTYVSQQCLPAIDINSLEGSFYEYAKQQGLLIGHWENEMTACLPTEEQKELLGIGDEALLLNAHTTCLDDGRVFEFIRTFYIGSRYTYCFPGGQSREGCYD